MNFLQRVLAGFVFGAAALAFAWPTGTPSKRAPSIAAISSTELDEQWMVEGEKRYRANCGRCHQPHKFPPRAMAMAIRHMRVRAMLTEDDMKYVLYYMTH